MAQLLTQWEPILASVQISATLAMKLIDQVDKYKKSKPLAIEIGRNISHLEERLIEFKQGAEITSMHATIAKDYLEESKSINVKIDKLIEKITNKKFFFFMRSISIYGELRDIKSSIGSLKSDVCTFGLALNNRIELNAIGERLEGQGGQRDVGPNEINARSPRTRITNQNAPYFKTPTGRKYHTRNNCVGLNRANAIYGVDEVPPGLPLCKHCRRFS